MIKVAIANADTPQAGELIRILAGHPDVMLESAQASGLEGLPVAAHHHGLIGETSLNFSKSIDLSRADVLFICGTSPTEEYVKEVRKVRPEIKIISFNPIRRKDGEKEDPTTSEEAIYALPEINRKALVRGGMTAVLPSPFASMSLVALFPLGKNLLLQGNLKLHIVAPADIIESADKKKLEKEIEEQLREIQKGFSGSVSVEFEESATRRTGLLSIVIDCPINLDHILQFYEVYDDHNFAFPVIHPVGVSEVAGTNKCVISIEKPEPNTLRLGAAADCRLRGGAGEAVHVMNLMFGLHEKTGLALKAIDFFPIQ